MWSFSRSSLALPVVLITVAQPAAGAEFLFGVGSTSADLLARNSLYAAAASDAINMSLMETPTTASLDATLAIGNVDAFLRADQRYRAADNSGYFGFERQAQVIVGHFGDIENDYDVAVGTLFGSYDFDPFYQATEDGFLRLSYDFASSGPAGSFDIMVDTDSLGLMTYGFTFDGTAQSGQMDIPIVAGEEVVVTFGSSFSKSESFGGGLTTYSGVVSYRLAEAIPEPATWAMMIVGFGMVGGLARRSRKMPLSA